MNILYEKNKNNYVSSIIYSKLNIIATIQRFYQPFQSFGRYTTGYTIEEDRYFTFKVARVTLIWLCEPTVFGLRIGAKEVGKAFVTVGLENTI